MKVITNILVIFLLIGATFVMPFITWYILMDKWTKWATIEMRRIQVELDKI